MSRKPVLPLLLGLIASLLALLPLRIAEDPAYRLLLGLREPLSSFREPLIIDAPAGTSMTPGRLARVLEDLAEFGSGSVLIDLPLDLSVGEGAPTLRLPLLRDAIDGEFTLVSDNLHSFWQAVRSGALRPADTASSFESLVSLIAASRDRLLAASAPRSEELPALGAALSLARPAFFSLGLLPAPLPLSSAETEFLAHAAIGAQTGAEDVDGVRTARSLPSIAGLTLPPKELMEAAAGLGFSTRGEEADVPGAAPAVPFFRPLAGYEGRLLPEAALLVLAERLGVSRIETTKDGILFVGANLPRQSRRDLLIPLNAEGRAYFDRTHSPEGLDRRMALARIEDYRRSEDELLASVRALEKAGYLVERAPPTLDWARVSALSEAMLKGQGATRDGATIDQGGSRESVAGLKAAKAAWFASVGGALSEKDRIDDLCTGLLSGGKLSEAESVGVENLRSAADAAFELTASRLSVCLDRRIHLLDEIGASICILGEEPRSGRSGLVPVGGAQELDSSREVAAFIRAGLSGRFIEEAPRMTAALAGSLAALLLSLLLFFASPRLVLALGTILATAFAIAASLILVEAGLWISPLAPILSALVPGIVAMLARPSSAKNAV